MHLSITHAPVRRLVVGTTLVAALALPATALAANIVGTSGPDTLNGTAERGHDPGHGRRDTINGTRGADDISATTATTRSPATRAPTTSRAARAPT